MPVTVRLSRRFYSGLRAELIKWMFVFWVGTVVTSVGLVFTVVGLIR